MSTRTAADRAAQRAPRGITNQRHVRERPDGLHVVDWRGRVFHADALNLLDAGSAVYVVADGAHGLAIYRDRCPAVRRPLCVATPAPAMKPADPDQLRLNA